MRADFRDVIERNIERSLTDPSLGLGTEVEIRQFDPSTSRNKFGESKSKTYKKPITLKGTIILDPNEEQLTSAGMSQEKASLLFRCSTKTLREKGLANKDSSLILSSDDILDFGGNTYDIVKVRPAAYLSGIPMIYIIGAKKVANNGP